MRCSGGSTPREYGLVHVDVPVWSTLEPVALVLAAGSMIAMLRFKVGMAWTLAAVPCSVSPIGPSRNCNEQRITLPA